MTVETETVARELATSTPAFPRYPACRDSGVEWLGEIPAHWEMKRLKYVCRMRYGDSLASESREPGDVPVFGSNGEVGTHTAANTLGPCLIIGRKGSYGKVTYSAVPCFVIDTAYSIDKQLTDSDLRWLFYALSCLALDEVSQDTGVPGLSREVAYNLWLPDVPIPEQCAIAAYLDREIARIDALVAAKERLIALLQEKRAALISHTVTRGLDPTAPMKDSAVPWLGQVPAHWDVNAVWMLFRLGRGRVISMIEIQDNQGPYPVYSSQTENDGVMGYLNTYDFEGAYLTWTTDGANAGTVFFRDGRFNCTNVCGTLQSLKTSLGLRYFSHALNIATSWFVRHDINPKLMNNVMARIRVPVPPIVEQHAIAAYLDGETSKLDTLIARIRQHIEKVKEYRAALISAAVTGKIDVRSQEPAHE